MSTITIKKNLFEKLNQEKRDYLVYDEIYKNDEWRELPFISIDNLDHIKYNSDRIIISDRGTTNLDGSPYCQEDIYIIPGTKKTKNLFYPVLDVVYDV